MDWIHKDESSEASGDSEADATAPASPSAIVVLAFDNDDAESSSGSYGDGDEGGEGGEETDLRYASWRGWLLECAAEYDAAEIGAGCDRHQTEGEVNSGSASTRSGGEAVATAAESDRLFWEACLANRWP